MNNTNTSIALAEGIHSIAQLRVIELLVTGSPVSMSTLAGRVGFSTAAMTGAVDVLEKRGLVERVRHPHDRRSITVKLTAKGLVFAAKLSFHEASIA